MILLVVVIAVQILAPNLHLLSLIALAVFTGPIVPIAPTAVVMYCSAAIVKREERVVQLVITIVACLAVGYTSIVVSRI